MIGKGLDKIVLQMYLVQYHGESQFMASSFTSEEEYSSDKEAILDPKAPTQLANKEDGSNYHSYSLGEYCIRRTDTDNSDHVIVSWMNNCDVQQVSALKLDYNTTNMSDYVRSSELEKQVLMEEKEESVCQTLNLGSNESLQNISVYDGITGLTLEEWREFFNKHKSAFAWTYADLKGIPAEVCEHRIILQDGVQPICQRQHRLNPKYSLLDKEELDKLLNVGFIYPIPYNEWVSPIVIVLKKNGKNRICQDFWKLIAATRKDYFSLPFTDSILDAVAGHECYSFLDGFSEYNQVKIAVEDRFMVPVTDTHWEASGRC
jgi:hypothetical protein